MTPIRALQLAKDIVRLETGCDHGGPKQRGPTIANGDRLSQFLRNEEVRRDWWRRVGIVKRKLLED